MDSYSPSTGELAESSAREALERIAAIEQHLGIKPPEKKRTVSIAELGDAMKSAYNKALFDAELGGL